MAFELLLIDDPPYRAYERHVGPGDEEREVVSRLVDERWVEVINTRLKDIDEMRERKRRLDQRQREKPPPTVKAKGAAAAAAAKAKAKAGEPP